VPPVEVLVIPSLTRESLRHAEHEARLARLSWLVADVVGVVPETPRVKTVRFDVPGWSQHLPGQHVDVRLTAEDGYSTERSYSIASAPDGRRIELTVERLDDGEVSPYLTEELRTGDQIELRGPVGGYFVWQRSLGGPLFLVGGGSGVVPLMAMLRHRAVTRSDVAATLLLSSRSWEDVIYRDELEDLSGDSCTIVHTLTRAQPTGWTGYARRVDIDMLRDVGPDPREHPRTFVCGPTPLVEAVASALVELGHDPMLVKTERFGPTGG
jgi:ferredoxin-NADP reductase